MSIPTVGTLAAERGAVAVSASKELLQDGVLHGLAAAAGCTLSKPAPDVNGIDWTITLNSPNHTNVWEAKIDVQLKCTHQTLPNNRGSFGYQLDIDHFNKLTQTKISNPRLLLVMLCPPTVDRWLHTGHSITAFRHSMYWVNLYGATTTAKARPTVQVPFSNRLDPMELCRLLHIVGNGAKPWIF